MLTEAEKKWLERRKNLCNRCGFQKNCSWRSQNIPCEKWGLFQVKAWGTKSGDVKHNFRDAAEFEARVAAKLAKSICFVCPDNKGGGCDTKNRAQNRACIEACRLRHARLAVEAEIDDTAVER